MGCGISTLVNATATTVEDGKGRADNRRNQAFTHDAWCWIADKNVFWKVALSKLLAEAKEGGHDESGNGEIASEAAVLTSTTTNTASIVGNICRGVTKEHGRGKIARDTVEKQVFPGAGI
jgi:hypothetical protein